ncbi:hypothetical protein [Nonlabens sp.]|uniref:hypothetical protein n=1 Tax=Nonlabens sp. TaxID=1888209 RepID=UPI0025CD438D|nr:hypothetical protein [Nonlabens sp.]
MELMSTPIDMVIASDVFRLVSTNTYVSDSPQNRYMATLFPESFEASCKDI